MNQPNQLIKEALSAAVKTINSGKAPTDALAKTATEFDLNPDYVQRVGEALNVALGFRHFKHASQREANYPIANIPEVIATVFNTTEKTSSQNRSESFRPAELGEKIPNYEKRLYNPRYKRAQMEILSAGEAGANVKFATTKEGLHNQAINYIRRLKMDHDIAGSEKVSAELSMNNAFATLVNHFSKTSHVRTPWHEIESQVYSKHGDAATPYIEHVYKTAGLDDERGATSADYTFFEPCKEAQMFDKVLDTAVAFCKAEDNLKDAEYNLNFEKEYYDGIFKDANAIPLKKNISAVEVAPVEPEKQAEVQEPVIDEFIEKLALNLLDILSHKLSDSVESKNQDRPNPLANTSRDNLQRTMVLQELIMTDPLLSKEPSSKVVSAYQQILRVAPELSKEKEVVRSLLREMMATQSLNPHTSNMLTEANINLMRQKMMLSQGSLPPK